MRHETKLLHLVESLGYTKPTGQDTHEFMRKKVSRLWNRSKEFRDFLTQHTAFLPKNVPPIQRWYYFRDSARKPRLCPICTKYIKDYKDVYCSHTCSTKESLGAKRGPKLDYAAREVELRKSVKPLGYTLVRYGKHKSTFRHKCGQELEATNFMVAKGARGCPCKHKKLMLHTLATLTEWHLEQRTGFTPRKLLGKDAVLVCNTCCHKFTTRKFYDRRCPDCFPNLFASNIVTHEEYVAELRKLRPALKVVGTYVNVRTEVRYKHTECGLEFDAKPDSVRRTGFRCPACAPKTRGSYLEFRRRGTVLKVRGKEAVALHWILKNTSIKLRDIEVDSEGTVPKIHYLADSRRREYRPDFFVRARNLIVEVKDLTTLGLRGNFFYDRGDHLWATNCSKAKACLDRGYLFQMLVFNRDNERMKLPKGWHDLTYKQILNWANKHGVV